MSKSRRQKDKVIKLLKVNIMELLETETYREKKSLGNSENNGIYAVK